MTQEEFDEIIRQDENNTTAVQWLKDILTWDADKSGTIKTDYIFDLLQEAEYREKEVIIKAFNNLNDNINGEQYYKETYKK